MKPRLLDLFCGAGGCSVGYARAGFDVYGLDIEPHKSYPYAFHLGDALDVLRRLRLGELIPFTRKDGAVEWLGLSDFTVIHASPPCQAYSSATKAWGREDEHPDLFDAVRLELEGADVPWVIENVEGAPVQNALRLCGSMFGLVVQRHRWFETRDLILNSFVCNHSGRSLTVTGHSPYFWDGGLRTMATTAEINEAMGIDWMSRRAIVQAIPPAYTEYIGGQLLDALERAA